MDTFHSRLAGRLVLVAATLAATLTTAVAGAAAPAASGVTGRTSTGLAAFPEFEGSGDLQVLPYVAGEVRVGHRYLALDGVALRANLVESAAWEAGPVASFAFGRDDGVDNAVLARLREIDDVLEVGAFVARSWSGVLRERDTVRLSLQARRNGEADGGGWLVMPALSYGTTLGERTYVAVELQATHANAAYQRLYYGVSPADAFATGLPAYTPGGGLRDVGIATTVSWALDDTWSIDGHLGLRRLVGDAADSPIVSREGTPTQVIVAIGIGRRF